MTVGEVGDAPLSVLIRPAGDRLPPVRPLTDKQHFDPVVIEIEKVLFVLNLVGFDAGGDRVRGGRNRGNG